MRPKLRVAFVAVLLCIIPILILIRALSQPGGLLTLLDFGEQFVQTQLPAVRALHPPTTALDGYDGQFYAQVALDPSLRDPDLGRALDNPPYRAQRIGLPFVAAIARPGGAALTLRVYALLNFVFWLALWSTLLYARPLTQWDQLAPVVAVLWSTGTLVSLARALPDLPAVTIGTAGLLLSARGDVLARFLSVSVLFKETSLLSAGAALARLGDDKAARVSSGARRLALIALPFGAWFAYVRFTLPELGRAPVESFALPFAGFVGKLATAVSAMISPAGTMALDKRIYQIFEILAPLSLAVQAAYLLLRPLLGNRTWAFGAGFAVLLIFLSGKVWAGAPDYCRVLLPLTVSFNLLLSEMPSGRSRWMWYAAGNVGLTGALARSIYGSYI